MTRATVLKLYKSMLCESRKFTGYNYREYALRRIRDAFSEHKGETNTSKTMKLIQKAEENLEILKRQTMISQMYKEPKLVIEQKVVNH